MPSYVNQLRPQLRPQLRQKMMMNQIYGHPTAIISPLPDHEPYKNGQIPVFQSLYDEKKVASLYKKNRDHYNYNSYDDQFTGLEQQQEEAIAQIPILMSDYMYD